MTHIREKAETADSSSQESFSTSMQAARLMTEHAITYDGRQYLYGPYRYDRLSDAVNYATLQATRGIKIPPVASAVAFAVLTPTQGDQQLMQSLDITFVDGVFHLGGYRYDRLSDAVNYARLRSQRIAP